MEILMEILHGYADDASNSLERSRTNDVCSSTKEIIMSDMDFVLLFNQVSRVSESREQKRDSIPIPTKQKETNFENFISSCRVSKNHNS